MCATNLDLKADVLDLINVWSEYGRSIDNLDYEYLLRLFTPDIVWASSIYGQAEGRQAVRELFEGNQAVASDGDPSKRRPWVHIMTNPWVQVDGDTAVGKFYMSAYFLEGAERKPRLVGLGDYQVDFVRVSGRWLIKSVYLDVFNAPDPAS
jgi:ketosteroid isomerase-like protein